MRELGRFEIRKLDEDRRVAFGWASVAKTGSGETVIDSQGDMVDPSELEASAYSYVYMNGEPREMHQGEAVGRLVESMVFTPEKLRKLGLHPDALPSGWWVGYFVDDDATWEGVKAGKLKAFSIGGSAQREDS